jgi:BirA family transcriptional regulator, biotin operon repressor / biotin---[acetyl-CoA-carboxylase] ligase
MDVETRQLQQRLNAVGCTPEIVLLKHSTTSTNDDVRACAEKGMRHILVSSQIQTAGRGQHERQWQSPLGNIYLSTLLNTDIAIDGRLALEVALNILQMPCLQNLNLQVKWPNDLYSAQGKWGGILVEPLSAHQTIVGVGMNVTAMQQHVPEQKITSLCELGLDMQISRIDLMAELYLAIQQAGLWFNHNSYNLAARFNHHAAFIGQAVSFEHHQGCIEGQFVGILNDGAVQLQNADGLHRFYQGRLRLKSV